MLVLQSLLLDWYEQVERRSSGLEKGVPFYKRGGLRREDQDVSQESVQTNDKEEGRIQKGKGLLDS